MSKKQTFQVAIDGPVAAGKGTAAKQVALRLGFLYVDTGAMYRAATLLFLEKNLDLSLNNQEQLVQELEGADFALKNVQDTDGNFYTQVKLNGRDVSDRIRQADVDQTVSTVAALPQVREVLVAKQQDLASKHNVVMEGRDIGTRVLPNATCKFYLTASLEVRAARRLEQQRNLIPGITLEEVTRQIQIRDKQDQSRATDPLVVAPDAQVVDTSGETIEETVTKLLGLIRAKIAQETS
ncbi:(d)CMP kinase [bacterium]|nr:(d)CMP kinase [bacterium]